MISSIFMIVLFFPSVFSFILNFEKIPLPSNSIGPKSIVFDAFQRGPYTSISDGRIVRYNILTGGFVDYAYTAPNRSKALCDGTNNPSLGTTCGRPLGLGFNWKTNELYIADAYLGLLKASSDGKVTTQLANSAEGEPIFFADELEVDQLSGDVYFTDASSKFTLSQIIHAVRANDSTGRLLKYSPKTKHVTVLLRNLAGPSGVTLSSDRSYVLVTEFIGKRVRKLWLSGHKANKSEILVQLEGRPDKLRGDIFGNYLVVINVQDSLQVPTVPKVVKINGDGAILGTFELEKYYKNITISEFNRRGLKTYVGSLDANFVGVLFGVPIFN